MKFFLTLTIIYSSLSLNFGQEYIPILPPENIKTAQLFNPQTNDQNPVIEMNKEYLILSFDDLNGGFKNYSYKLELRNPDWSKTNAFSSEFIRGYTTGFIRDSRNSFNTYQNYTHYRVNIPNEDMIPTVSGNYILNVYEGKSQKPVFTKRFVIYEPLTDVFINVQRLLGNHDKNQQVSVQVQSDNFDLTENPNGADLRIIKNGNLNEYLNPQPQFTQPIQFTYNHPSISFEGSAEHLFFDTKNIQSGSQSTQRIERVDSVFHTILYYDFPESSDLPYTDNPDVNGAFFIRNVEIPNEFNANTQADYTWVHFGLEEFDDQNGNKEIYLVGAFNDWELNEENRMKKVEPDVFETSIFLKQGYYNYKYVVWDKKKQKLEPSIISGSFWETENLYQAFFYYKPWGARYFQLVGYNEAYSRPSSR